MLNIYNGIYVAAISLAIHMLIGSYAGIPYMYGFLAMFIFLISTGFEYMSLVKPYTRRTIITAAVVLYLILVFAGVLYYIKSDTKSLEGIAEMSAGFRIYITIMSAILITAVCGLIQRIKFVSDIFACCLLIFIIGVRISGGVVELEVFILALYVFIMSVCRIGKDVHYMFMSPVIMIFCAALYFIPTGTEPMNWNNVLKVIDIAGGKISDMWSDMVKATGLDIFDSNVRRIGYSDDENIDIVDEIVGNNRTQLIVVGRQCASSIYLRGSYYNIYNGEGWERNYTAKSYPEYEVMLFETLNNVLNQRPSRYKHLINNMSRIKVQYKGLETDNVFMPYNAIRKDITADYGYDNGVLRFDNMPKENDYYKIWYLNMNENSYSKLYATPGKKGYNSASDIVKFADSYMDCNIIGNLNNISLDRIDDLLSHRKEYVEENYMNIPECVPERVYKLAKEITFGAKNDYEKVKRIERYLNQNYKYNKKVTRSYLFGKKNECSVDDFLFETKEGSCMHYASALAILARCIGFPSRITTGYCMRYNDDTGEWVEHSVVGGEGHAWIEVYMGVYGWMRLDPTPTYHENAYLDDGLNEKDIAASNSSAAGTSSHAEDNQLIYDNSGIIAASPVPEELTEDVSDTQDKDNTQKNTKNPAGKDTSIVNVSGANNSYVFIIVLVSFIIILICILCMLTYYRMRSLRYTASNNADKCSRIIDEIMHRYIKDMKKAGKRAGLGNCTLNESIDIMSEWLGDERDDYKKLIIAYQGKVFGDIRIDRHTVRQAEHMLNRLGKRKNKILKK